MPTLQLLYHTTGLYFSITTGLHFSGLLSIQACSSVDQYHYGPIVRFCPFQYHTTGRQFSCFITLQAYSLVTVLVSITVQAYSSVAHLTGIKLQFYISDAVLISITIRVISRNTLNKEYHRNKKFMFASVGNDMKREFK